MSNASKSLETKIRDQWKQMGWPISESIHIPVVNRWIDMQGYKGKFLNDWIMQHFQLI